MKSRTFLAISFVVAVLLTGAIFYPGALTEPYSGDSESYSIAHESTEAFNETASQENSNTESVTSIEELSEIQQKAFREAKDQPQEEGRYGPSGERDLEIRVCDSTLIFCDEYNEVPNPSSDDSRYTLVEDSNGETYIVQVGQPAGGATWDTDGLDMIFETVIKLLILGPYALFLIYRVWTVTPPEPTDTMVGYGAVLFAAVVAYPYLLMLTEISLPSWHLPAFAVITWSVIVAERWRSRTKPKSSHASD
ncbi:hypothetical protein [Natrinema amylolyticum]|uniref:hypothetical protein n=1 Tax=Natrinema amylolyticum TaxID=2878679 RepID=UPI001CFC0350|nr:hypothetical protein [Natrinema amylolyticum]